MSETYVTYRVWDGCKAPINLEYSGRLIGQIVRESTIDRDALFEGIWGLKMITDKERREVAYRLRNMSKYTNPDNVYDSLSQATGVDDVIDGNGSLVAYLADLIDPDGADPGPRDLARAWGWK